MFTMKSLHIADGGIVTSLPEVGSLTMQFDVGDLHIFGGGSLHSVSVAVSAGNLTVDDLGVLRGDLIDDKYDIYGLLLL